MSIEHGPHPPTLFSLFNQLHTRVYKITHLNVVLRVPNRQHVLRVDAQGFQQLGDPRPFRGTGGQDLFIIFLGGGEAFLLNGYVWEYVCVSKRREQK